MVDRIREALMNASFWTPGTADRESQTDQTGTKLLGNDQKSGLIDQLGLSSDARSKVLYARSQFELNYQVLKASNTANGFETSVESFSFQSSYEFLQQASGAESVDNTDELTDQDVLTKLQEYFSPENTAQRILDVALSFFSSSSYGKTGGNTEDSRKNFAEFIGAAIDEGFSQARDILGKLPEEVESGIDKTHSIVFDGLNDFVKNGIDSEKAQKGGVYDKIQSFRAEFSMSYRKVTTTVSASGYNADGTLTGSSEDNSTISTEA